MNKMSEELVLPAAEDDRIIHADDGEQKLPDAEKVKEENNEAAIKELEDRKDSVEEINDVEAPKIELKDGDGKKVKGLTEKLVLDEEDLCEDATEDYYKKLGFLLDELGIDPMTILDHISVWMSPDDLNRCLADFITDNDLEDEASFLDEQFPRFRPLGEAIPKDLAKAYHNASYRGTKGSLTDLQNSEYQTIDINNPEDAALLKKVYKEDPTKIKLRLGTDLVDFRANGKPDLDHRVYYVGGDKAYIRSSGTRINDTRKMPLSHLIKIADKVYIANEVEKDQDLLNKRKQNPESKNWNGEKTRYGASGRSELRGTYEPSTYDYRYNKRYLETSLDRLRELEDKYRRGEISEDDYKYYKDDYLADIKTYRRRISDYESKIKDYRANRRYASSTSKLQEPYRKYHRLKQQLDSNSEILSNRKDKLEDVLMNGSSQVRDDKRRYQELLDQLKDVQKKIKFYEIKLEGSDEDDQEAINEIQKQVDDINSERDDIMKEYNKLFRRETNAN